MKITQTKPSEILMAESLVGGFIYLFLTGFTGHTMGAWGLKAVWKKQPPGICLGKH